MTNREKAGTLSLGESPDEKQSEAQPDSGHTGQGKYHARTRGARNPLGRFPWTHALNEYVRQKQDDAKSKWSDSTAFERRRLLVRVHKDLLTIVKAKTDEIPPKSVTAGHVRDYIDWLNNHSGRNQNTQRKALEELANFLLSTGNINGDKMRSQFPEETESTRPRPKYNELAQGFDRLSNIFDDWQRSIARGQGALYIGTMVRPSEGRLAQYGDLDQQGWTFRVRHPKGKTKERTVPFIHQRCKEEMAKYISERSAQMNAKGLDPTDPTKPLFPSFGRKNVPRFYSPQGFNKAWRKAWPGMEHYCARRGMAQEAVDKDPRLVATVSRMLGHKSVDTTLKYYTKIRLERVRDELSLVWDTPIPTTISPKTPSEPQSPPTQRKQRPPFDPAYS